MTITDRVRDQLEGISGRRARLCKVVAACAALLAMPAVGGTIDPSFAGIWTQRGYGTILQISPTRLITYELTDISCKQVSNKPLAEAAKEFDRVERIPNGFTLFEVADVSRYEFRSLPKLPQRCNGVANAPTVRDPELNFWVLWHAFRENYAFFDLREVDWDDIYERFRPGISATTSDDDLFDTFSDMLETLNDGHVGIESDDDEFFSGSDGELLELWESITGTEDGFDEAVQAHIVNYALKGQAKTAANGTLIYGWAAPGVGYISSMSMDLSDDDNDIELPVQLREVDLAMTKILREFAGAKALIIDARFNDGGYDAFALKLAGSFTRQARHVYSKKAAEGEAYTPPQSVYLNPSSTSQYNGPVFYLQSGTTISAGEIFSMAMQVLPNVTSIGTPTYGALSDQLEKDLPNGWTLSLSNEVYLTPDGQSYEGSGIPPDIRLNVSGIRDFNVRLRLDIDRALSLAGVRR